MRKTARQHLEEQLQRLAHQHEETKRKLRALARQERHARQLQYGELVEDPSAMEIFPDQRTTVDQ